MHLIPHEDVSVNAKKKELYRYRELKDKLIGSLEKLDARYRANFPTEITKLFDLEVALKAEQSKFMKLMAEDAKAQEHNIRETIEEKKKRKQENKTLKKLYRQISNLCHEDKLNHRIDINEDSKFKLKELFKDGKNCYENEDLAGLRYVYDLIIGILSGNSEVDIEVLTEQYKKTIQASDAQLIKELDEQIKSVLAELKMLESTPMYAVLKFDSEKQFDKARGVYHQILTMNIIQMQQELHKIKQNILNKIKSSIITNTNGQSFINIDWGDFT